MNKVDVKIHKADSNDHWEQANEFELNTIKNMGSTMLIPHPKDMALDPIAQYNIIAGGRSSGKTHFLKTELKAKAFDIIKTKRVDIKKFRFMLSFTKEFRYIDYCRCYIFIKQYSENRLTEEEFELLKEALK